MMEFFLESAHFLTGKAGSVSFAVLAFLFVLTVLIFVHEFGHYWVAKKCGVHVEVFSIGFGKKIWSRADRSGTLWQVCVVPFGGYVKMFGDGDVTSGTASDASSSMTPEEQKTAFAYKNVWQRSAIVAAGPLINFLFAVLAMSVLFMTFGQPYNTPKIGSVAPESPAEAAGFLPGDLILKIDNWSIQRFEEVQQIVRINQGEEIKVLVEREGVKLWLTALPEIEEMSDRMGNTYRIGRLGVARDRGAQAFKQYRNPFTAIWQGTRETGLMIGGTFKAMTQMIVGRRSVKEIGGPIQIAQFSAEFAKKGAVPLLWFMAMLSVSLGVINLFPIPMLDGGHLFFYLIEILRGGRPLSEKIQRYALQAGMFFVLSLAAFAVLNDLYRFPAVSGLVKGLFS